MSTKIIVRLFTNGRFLYYFVFGLYEIFACIYLFFNVYVYFDPRSEAMLILYLLCNQLYRSRHRWGMECREKFVQNHDNIRGHTFNFCEIKNRKLYLFFKALFYHEVKIYVTLTFSILIHRMMYTIVCIWSWICNNKVKSIDCDKDCIVKCLL